MCETNVIFDLKSSSYFLAISCIIFKVLLASFFFSGSFSELSTTEDTTWPMIANSVQKKNKEKDESGGSSGRLRNSQ